MGHTWSRLSLNVFIILCITTTRTAGQRWLTSTAEKVPQTCLRSCLMMLDPYRYLEGKSNVKYHILRRGSGIGDMGLGGQAPLGSSSKKTGARRVPGQESPDSEETRHPSGCVCRHGSAGWWQLAGCRTRPSVTLLTHHSFKH